MNTNARGLFLNRAEGVTLTGFHRRLPGMLLLLASLLGASLSSQAVEHPVQMTATLHAGIVELRVSAAPGTTYQIQSSTNLVDWVDCGEALMGVKPGVLTANEPLAERCFYHAMPMPVLAAVTNGAGGNITLQTIYGTDDRVDLYQETDPMRRRLAAATCALVQADDVVGLVGGGYDIRTEPYWGYSYDTGVFGPVCADERFAQQRVAAFCSGFLVGSNLIATAGHCLETNDLPRTRFVFGFVMRGPNDQVTQVAEAQVYRGVKIVARDFFFVGGLDYCIVELDRTVTAPDASPLPVRRDGQIATDTPIGVIGHPSGLPEKLAFGRDTLVRANLDANYFSANLDAYAGNSGSPVFDAQTGLVEGILTATFDDDYFPANGCMRLVTLPDATAGKVVFRSTAFAAQVPRLPSEAPSDSTLSRTELYVDANADDVERDGSPEHPFRLVQEAYQIATEGSTIIVRAGMYPELFKMVKRLTIRSEGGPAIIGSCHPTMMAWQGVLGFDEMNQVKAAIANSPADSPSLHALRGCPGYQTRFEMFAPTPVPVPAGSSVQLSGRLWEIARHKSVSGVSVQLWMNNNKFVATGNTDWSGNFRFSYAIPRDPRRRPGTIVNYRYKFLFLGDDCKYRGRWRYGSFSVKY